MIKIISLLEEQFICTPFKRFVAANVLGSVLFASLVILSDTVDETPPIAAFHGVEVLNGPVPQGENVLVRIYRDKVRNDCPITSLRHANDADGRLFHIPAATWKGGGVGSYVDLEYPTSHLPGGAEYTLYVGLSYNCPGGYVFNTRQPDIRFRVLP